MGVDAHPLDVLGAVAVEPLGLGDVEDTQRGFELAIPVGFPSVH